MTMYDVMYEAINEQYENGEITFEQANELNELAYDKYVVETSKASKEKRDQLYYGLDKKDETAKYLGKLRAGAHQTPNNIHSSDRDYDYINLRKKGYDGEKSKYYSNDDVHKRALRQAKAYKDKVDIDDTNINKKSLTREDGKNTGVIRYSSKSPNAEPSEKRQKLIKKLEAPKNMYDRKREGYNFNVSPNKNDMTFYYTKRK